MINSTLFNTQRKFNNQDSKVKIYVKVESGDKSDLINERIQEPHQFSSTTAQGNFNQILKKDGIRFEND